MLRTENLINMKMDGKSFFPLTSSEELKMDNNKSRPLDPGNRKVNQVPSVVGTFLTSFNYFHASLPSSQQSSITVFITPLKSKQQDPTHSSK